MSTTTNPATTIRTEQAALTTAPKAARLVALDIFRGLTIAGMILVNDPGTWDAVYGPLRHAEWHGWTPTDLVFPFFLFIVGVSMVLSFAGRRERGDSRGALVKHAIRRSLIIFAIGLFLSAFPRFDFSTIRIYGVLQRIAVVYLVASVIVLYLGRRARVAVSLALLLGYWALLMLVPVPGHGAGDLTMDGNLVGYVDRAIMYNHLWVKQRFDPEGLLSTFPAIVTTLIGVLVGEWIRGAGSAGRLLSGLLGGGAALMAMGWVWGLSFPINKMLWTSSYVLFTGGFGMVLLGACYWLSDVKGWRAWGQPFVWLGSNAIVVYALSSFLADCLGSFRIGEASIKDWTYARAFAPLAEPVNASLLFAITYVLLFVALAWVMHRKRIFVKV